jgi:hypothetical protein
MNDMEELTIRLRGDSALTKLPPVLWNKDEVTAALNEMLAAYKGRQYTEEEIKDAKRDRASVNKIKDGLTAARRRVDAMYKDPVAAFDADIKELCGVADAVAGAIDDQVKQVEEARKADKRAQFEAAYNAAIGDDLRPLVPFDKLLDPRWLNASAAFATAKAELLTRIETCRAEIDTLRTTCGEDFEAVERVYLRDLSIRDALAEYKRITDTREAQRRAEEARQAAEAARRAAPIVVPPSDETRAAQAAGASRAEANQIITEEGRLDFSSLQPKAEPEQPKWYNFGAWLTRDDIAALRTFFASRNIQYGKAKI